ncbi:glycosyltransferase family 4 protein [Rubrivirga sp. IMCC43871]|uniref:glycosyltransferase family 4 protein n=1 Tax=Rubrivirga sp. IMCC43871 TaxID=3391575 RepID=UPI00398FDA0A
MSPLRIALFTGNYNHIEDGVSRTLGRLVGYLERQGHQVMVLGPTIDDPLDQPGQFVAVPSVAAPGRPEYRVSTRFPASTRREVERFAPHIVHIATPDVLGHRALGWARGLSIPVVSTYHTHFASYLDFYRLGLAEGVLWATLRRFYNRCDEVYAPTPTMRDAIVEHGITSTVRLWPRGIELDRFRPDARSDAWRRSVGASDDDVIVSFVSRLVKEKGIDVFAHVVRTLAAEGVPVRPVIVGDGPEREALAAVLPDAALLGHQSGDDLTTAYASSDIFLFPSETETFGNVTLEAQASGLAVVAADAAGSASLVDHETTGLLCPPRDRAAFVDATRRLALDPDLRQRLGANAREAATGYDWAEVLGRMVRYYRGATDSSKSGTIAA